MLKRVKIGVAMVTMVGVLAVGGAAGATPAVAVAVTSEAAQAAPASSEIATKDRARALGRVHWWNAAKGFGFVTQTMSGGAKREFFMHVSYGVENSFTLKSGDVVSFIVGMAHGRQIARDVKEM
ncbi:cold-shock protein [Streptomyces sp. NPDC059564]|uniref:cold-shock protein n=1 Tax=Streptomyces sp. NPDC059564 TaxID=3346865 RepID=UPI0036C1F9DB